MAEPEPNERGKWNMDEVLPDLRDPQLEVAYQLSEETAYRKVADAFQAGVIGRAPQVSYGQVHHGPECPDRRQDRDMEPDLSGLSAYAQCGEFGFPARAWRLMLALAEQYGWQPQGTAPPDEQAIEAGIWQGEPADWDGRYFPAYGQNVTSADATALAAALERTLPDIPEQDVVKERAEGHASDWTPVSDWSWFATAPEVPVAPLDAFSGPNKQTLRDFIAHCREGGLWLY